MRFLFNIEVVILKFWHYELISDQDFTVLEKTSQTKLVLNLL